MREVRVALLEADVHYSVVKELITRIRERAVGTEVSGALNPAQQVIKIVHEELIGTLGSAPEPERSQTARDHAGRPAGRRQDHRRCQTGQPVAQPGRTGHAGGRRA